MENTKSVLKSKTFWFGLLTALAPLIPGAKEWIADNVLLMTSLWGGLAMLLRLVTKDKVVLLD